MEYTKIVKKLVTTDFKSNEEFYKERDKQMEIAQKKLDELNEKIRKIEEEKEEYERTLNQLRIF